MKHVVLRSGAPTVVETPAPTPERGRVIVANRASVISSGTERSSVAAQSASLPVRALRNPDLVRQTIRHAREQGVRQTADVIRGVLADDSLLGYSSAGIVIDTGGASGISLGQSVACAGAGFATHAEYVSVPANLVAPIPEGVSFHDAAFTTLAAIALQGVRRAEPTLGERVVVVGLGLLGLITAQLLRASGCQVLGVEPVAARRDLARTVGVDSVVEPGAAAAAVKSWTAGVGADVVIITASASGDEVINSAVAAVRRKGRVVPVGDVGFGIDRAPLYQREADVLISTSYGPGRYDPSYEEHGVDYPIAYVRWTENRNMAECLRLLQEQRLQVAPLVSLELPIDQAGAAYAQITGPDAPLAAVLTYDGPAALAPKREVIAVGPAARPSTGDVRIAIIGPGAFIRSTYLPKIKSESRAAITIVVSRTGSTATDVARAVGGADVSTDWRAALERDDVDLLVVGTRHDSHAEIAAAGLRAGKAVFVEKPLGLSWDEIDDVRSAAAGNERLAIGFNRPFAPLSEQLESEVRGLDGPVQVIYRVNAPLEPGHWLNDPVAGGGRVLGEACHMLDYANWLCGSPVRVSAVATPAPAAVASPETVTITVSYADGSIATVHYSGLGAPAMPKERIEVFRSGASWVLDDFRALTTFDAQGQRNTESRRADKGHATLFRGVLAACRGEQPFAPGIGAAYRAQVLALSALESIASGEAVAV